MLEVIFTSVPGAVFSWTGLFTKDARRILSRITFLLMLPCLSFVDVASQLDVTRMRQWWPVLANALLSVIIGVVVGLVSNYLFGVHKKHHKLVICCTSVGNLSTLPLLIVMGSLCYSKYLPFAGLSTDGDECSASAVAIVVLGNAVHSLFKFVIPVRLLQGDEATDLPASKPTKVRSKVISYLCPGLASGCEEACGGLDVHQPKKILERVYTFPEYIVRMNSECEPSEDEPSGAMSCDAGDSTSVLHRCRDILLSVWRWTKLDGVWKPLQPIIELTLFLFPLPALAAIAGIIVGLVPTLKGIFFPLGEAPLAFFSGAMGAYAVATVFSLSFVLGAVVSQGAGKGKCKLGSWRVIVVVGVARLLLSGIIGQVIVFGSYFLGWWQLPQVDGQTFLFILLIQTYMPTTNQAQNIAVMLGSYEDEIGAILFWQYVACIVLIPLWMTLDIWLMMAWGIL